MLRERVLKGEYLMGAWSCFNSPATVELIGVSGYDWVLLDSEHAPTTTVDLMSQLQALSRYQTQAIIRVPWLDRVHIKWALDIGAHGIMIPYVETEAQARDAVSFMRYPPLGVRGVADCVRAYRFGEDFKKQFFKLNDELLTVVQIETAAGVEHCEAIAAVDGIDVLFVGPMDLSTNLQMYKAFEDERFLEVLQKIADAAHQSGKAAGILLPNVDCIPLVRKMGFTFIDVATDAHFLLGGLKSNLAAMQKYK